MLTSLAEEYSFTILATEVMPDHIHLLLNCKPQFLISDMVKILKGNTARRLFMKHPELKDCPVGRTSVESVILCGNRQ